MDPLPAISKGFAQALDVRRGRCWVTLKRLDPSALDRTRAEFEARNPGATAQDVDPFTGHLEGVVYSRDKEAEGPRVELSDEALHSRTLSPLRRNADLFGLTAADLELLEWKPRYVDEKRRFVTVTGAIPCRDEAGRLGAGVNPCWEVIVHLKFDGVVSSVMVDRFGPPVPMCTTPAVGKAKVRTANGLDDASPARALDDRPRRRVLELGAKVPVEQPSLAIERSFGDRQSESKAPSVTWRLVWTARFVSGRDLKFFVVDAVSGKQFVMSESHSSRTASHPGTRRALFLTVRAVSAAALTRVGLAGARGDELVQDRLLVALAA